MCVRGWETRFCIVDTLSSREDGLSRRPTKVASKGKEEIGTPTTTEVGERKKYRGGRRRRRVCRGGRGGNSRSFLRLSEKTTTRRGKRGEEKKLLARRALKVNHQGSKGRGKGKEERRSGRWTGEDEDDGGKKRRRRRGRLFSQSSFRPPPPLSLFFSSCSAIGKIAEREERRGQVQPFFSSPTSPGRRSEGAKTVKVKKRTN